MITLRAFVVGFVGFCFYLIAVVNSLPSIFYGLPWLTVSILFSSLGIALLSLAGLSCSWKAARTRVSETLVELPRHTDRVEDEAAFEGASTGPLIELELANFGSLNKTNILIEARLLHVRRNRPITRRYVVEALPAGASLASALPLYNLPRGRYRLLALRLIGSDVLGLFRVRRDVPVMDASRSKSQDGTNPGASSAGGGEQPDLIVGPAVVALHSGQASVDLGAGESGRSAVRLVGQGEELRGTRPYQAGDDLRRVHWKSTARLGELVVKEFHYTTQTRCAIVWDGASYKDWGAEPGAAVEFSLRLVASLSAALNHNGQLCSLLRLDSQPLWIAPGRELSPAGGSAIQTRVAEALAEAEADRVDPLAPSLNAHLQGVVADSDFYLITPQCDSEVLAAARLCQSRGVRVTVGALNAAAAPVSERSSRMELGAPDVRIVSLSYKAGDGNPTTAVAHALGRLLERNTNAPLIAAENSVLAHGSGSSQL